MPHISLAAEKIGSLGPLPITNSLLATWSVMAFLIILAYVMTRRLTLIPSNMQSVVEVIIDGMYTFFGTVLGHNVKKIFPLIATIFLFVIVANWEGLLPGFGTIGIFHETSAVSHSTSALETSHETVPEPETVIIQEESDGVVEKSEPITEAIAETKEEKRKFTPLLRGATADLNMTIALAIIAFLSIQYFGFSLVGHRYSSRFINFSNPITFFVGILEIISDLSKIISFSFRLFGNIFAGEVLLVVIAFLVPFLAPMPFLMLELFVGFIQAVVFSTLTSVFINVAVAHEE